MHIGIFRIRFAVLLTGTCSITRYLQQMTLTTVSPHLVILLLTPIAHVVAMDSQSAHRFPCVGGAPITVNLSMNVSTLPLHLQITVTPIPNHLVLVPPCLQHVVAQVPTQTSESSAPLERKGFQQRQQSAENGSFADAEDDSEYFDKTEEDSELEEWREFTRVALEKHNSRKRKAQSKPDVCKNEIVESREPIEKIGKKSKRLYKQHKLKHDPPQFQKTRTRKSIPRKCKET